MSNPALYGTDPDEGFEEFYREHFRELSRFVRRRVDASDVPDVIAQVFTVAWRRFEQVPPPPAGRLWLFGVARRSIADHRRSLRRRLQMHQHILDELRPPTFDSDNDNDHVLGRVESAIARLRPKDHEVLYLVLWDDLSHDEAAAVLGCSANAVEHRFRRARQRVRDALEPPAHTISTPEWRTQP